MIFECTPAEFIELISNPLAAQALAPLLEKVTTMSNELNDLAQKVTDLETAAGEQAAQSQALRITVGQLVTVANECKAALDQALAGNVDVAQIAALSSRVDALTAQAQADTAADTTTNQAASEAVTVDAPAN